MPPKWTNGIETSSPAAAGGGAGRDWGAASGAASAARARASGIILIRPGCARAPEPALTRGFLILPVREADGEGDRVKRGGGASRSQFAPSPPVGWSPLPTACGRREEWNAQ